MDKRKKEMVEVLTTKEHRFNRGIRINLKKGGIDIKFNDRGVAEVDARLVEELMNKDNSISLLANKETVSKAIQEVEGREIGEIVAINESLKAVNKDLTAKLATSEKENTILKVEIEKLKKAMPSSTISLENEKVVEAKRITSNKLKSELAKNTEAELKEILRQDKNTLPLEKEWKDLNKEKLIEFILSH